MKSAAPAFFAIHINLSQLRLVEIGTEQYQTSSTHNKDGEKDFFLAEPTFNVHDID